MIRVFLFTLFILSLCYQPNCFSNAYKNESLNITSYNVYFDDVTGAKRYPEIIKMLKLGNYDVIALQECTPSFLALLRQEPKLARYYISQGSKQHGYSNVILTNQPITSWGNIKLVSNIGRSAPYIVLENSNTLITSVHLESGIFDQDMREAQLKTIMDTSENYTNVVIAGDVNFGDGADEEKQLTNFIDLGAKNKQTTYDVENNTLAKQTKFMFEQSRRLDRIFAKCKQCKPNAFKVNKLPFSDHWAIEAKLVFN